MWWPKAKSPPKWLPLEGCGRRTGLAEVAAGSAAVPEAEDALVIYNGLFALAPGPFDTDMLKVPIERALPLDRLVDMLHNRESGRAREDHSFQEAGGNAPARRRYATVDRVFAARLAIDNTGIRTTAANHGNSNVQVCH